MSMSGVSMATPPVLPPVTQARSAPPAPIAKDSDGDRDGSGSSGSANLMNIKA